MVGIGVFLFVRLHFVQGLESQILYLTHSNRSRGKDVGSRGKDVGSGDH